MYVLAWEQKCYLNTQQHPFFDWEARKHTQRKCVKPFYEQVKQYNETARERKAEETLSSFALLYHVYLE